MHTALHKSLGVKPDAGMTEIRQAYRRLAQQLHPDKGGSTEQWQQIQLAYDVLSCPQRRSRYEATGQVDVQDHAANAKAEVVGALMAVIDGCPDVHTEDLVASTMRVIRDVQQRRYEMIDELKRQIRKREIAMKRLPPELAQLLAGDINQRRMAIVQTTELRENGARALQLLAKHGAQIVQTLRNVA